MWHSFIACESLIMGWWLVLNVVDIDYSMVLSLCFLLAVALNVFSEAMNMRRCCLYVSLLAATNK